MAFIVELGCIDVLFQIYKYFLKFYKFCLIFNGSLHSYWKGLFYESIIIKYAFLVNLLPSYAGYEFMKPFVYIMMPLSCGSVWFKAVSFSCMPTFSYSCWMSWLLCIKQCCLNWVKTLPLFCSCGNMTFSCLILSLEFTIFAIFKLNRNHYFYIYKITFQLDFLTYHK